MYNKVARGSSQRTYPAESKVPNKNEDYVYLALVNNGQLHGDHIQEPTGCRLSPARCLDRVRPMSTGTSADSIGRRHRKLLIASGVTNAALLALLLPLGAVCVYLVLTRKFILLPHLFLLGKIKLTLFQINEILIITLLRPPDQRNGHSYVIRRGMSPNISEICEE